MNEPLYIKSKERIRFEPFCVNCGQLTKRTFHVDTATPRVVSWISILIPYSIIFNYFIFMRKGMVHIPFCSKCYRKYFFPDRRLLIAVVGAVALLGLFFYFMTLEWYFAAIVSIVAAFATLIAMFREDRRRSRVTMPFQVWRESGEFTYQFKSGYYYNLLKRSPGNDEAR